MKRIKPQHFLILLLVAAIAAAPFLIRGLIDRSSVGKQPAAAVTAAPEETAEPTPTPEPTPLQFTTVDASYFDDALFIGDSRTVGIAEYGSLKNATYFADVGLNVYVAQTKAVAVKNVGTVTLPQLSALLDGAGLPLYGTALRHDTVDVRSRDRRRCARGIGSAGQGARAETLALCRETLRIPMTPHCESLNAAAAAAVLLWEAYRAEEGN